MTLRYTDLKIPSVNQEDFDSLSSTVRVLCSCGREITRSRARVLDANRTGKMFVCEDCKCPKRTEPCGHCGKEITKPVHKCKNSTTLYCGNDCFKKATDSTVLESCLKCGKEFQAKAYKKKKYCSRQCAVTHATRKYPPKTCEWCGMECKIRYCGTKCSQRAQRTRVWDKKGGVPDWMVSPIDEFLLAGTKDPLQCKCKKCGQGFANIYDSFRKQRNPRGWCMECISPKGEKTRKDYRHVTLKVKKQRGRCDECKLAFYALLDTHHRDGDRTNNSEDNLEVLCKNCHACRHLVKEDGKWRFSSATLTPLDQIPSWLEQSEFSR